MTYEVKYYNAITKSGTTAGSQPRQKRTTVRPQEKKNPRKLKTVVGKGHLRKSEFILEGKNLREARDL